ncbi:phosphopantetheine-binding protein [Rhodocyclus tenuis]|uniref:Acyl carrier protein n=1 Tax=Rhodocyclus tenuis TaxID=1066 RepID=A0A840GB23_RHOTE|nr:phosphopantetheine-binding protein [Rhodocyclus tenuis]MBB4247868.1 acyl carrier protein [Rhodocyclus tenuis]
MNDIQSAVLRILDRELNLNGRAQGFKADTRLRGALPQLDSMAIVSLISALESDLGFEFPEDLLDGTIFETVGSLTACVTRILESGQS